MYSCTLTFQTLLGSFVQRTCRTTSPLNLHLRSRCFASAKILLFPFRPTLFEKIFHLFYTFSLSAVSQFIAECFCRLFAFFMTVQPPKIRLYRQISGGFFNENITNRHENPKNMNAVAWIVCAKCHAPAREYTRSRNNPFFYHPRI